MFSSFQNLLPDLINNRLGSIEREIDRIYPHVSYTPDEWAYEEWQEYNKVLMKFDKKYPFKEIPKILNLPAPKMDDLSWFNNLDNFLNESEKRKKEQDEGDSRLNPK